MGALKLVYHFAIFCVLRSEMFHFGQAAFVSMSDRFGWIDEELKLIDAMQKFMEIEHQRLQRLEKYKDTLRQNAQLFATEEEFAWNPLAIYRTVKYLTVDLDVVKNNMTKINHDIILQILEEENVFLPDGDHLYDDVRGLVSQRRMYNLTFSDLLVGHLPQNNVTLEFGLSVEGCFHVGKISAEKYDYETAVDWLRGCEYKFDNATLDEALEILLPAALFIGNESLAGTVVKKLRKKEKHSISRALMDLDLKLSKQLDYQRNNERQIDQWESFYTCAGDYEKEVAARNLKCRYNRHNSPYLIIAPLKEEILSLVPKISVFREFLYDSEIEMLKTEASDQFRTSIVGRGAKRLVDPSYRLSEQAYFDNMQPKYLNLRNRLEDMSSLSLKLTEPFQVMDYSPGGYFRAHSDYIPNLAYSNQGFLKGNRIATSLTYMTDVPVGGQTVFPRLKLSVKPVKGTVLIWTNMKLDGSEEGDTQHAGCPVVYGEKMALSQPFRIRGQDHWIAESQDDVTATHSVNPNRLCFRKRIASIS